MLAILTVANFKKFNSNGCKMWAWGNLDMKSVQNYVIKQNNYNFKLQQQSAYKHI